MDVDEIRTFVSIAQLGGFTRAAGRLNRSQPAISRRIGLIEQELGAPLLERVRGGVKLTEAGRAFLPFAEAVLAAIEDGRAGGARHRQRAARRGLAGAGRDAGRHPHRRRAAPVRAALQERQSRPADRLEHRGQRPGAARGGHPGLRYFDNAHPDLVSRVVGAEPLLVICSADHPLAGKRIRSAQQLAGERWVAFPAARGRELFGRVLERQLVSAGLDGAAVTLIDSLTAQKRLVEAGFGIALVPESSVRDELRLGTLKRLDAPELRTTVPVTIIHRRKGYLSSAARALLALMSGEALRLKRGQGDKKRS